MFAEDTTTSDGHKNSNEVGGKTNASARVVEVDSEFRSPTGGKICLQQGCKVQRHVRDKALLEDGTLLIGYLSRPAKPTATLEPSLCCPVLGLFEKEV